MSVKMKFFSESDNIVNENINEEGKFCDRPRIRDEIANVTSHHN